MRNEYLRSVSLLAAGALAATVVWQSFDGAVAANTDTYKQLNLFGDIFERVRADYVDEVSDQKLIESAVNGMLSSLDPPSGYLNQ